MHHDPNAVFYNPALNYTPATGFQPVAPQAAPPARPETELTRKADDIIKRLEQQSRENEIKQRVELHALQAQMGMRPPQGFVPPAVRSGPTPPYRPGQQNQSPARSLPSSSSITPYVPGADTAQAQSNGPLRMGFNTSAPGPSEGKTDAPEGDANSAAVANASILGVSGLATPAAPPAVRPTPLTDAIRSTPNLSLPAKPGPLSSPLSAPLASSPAPTPGLVTPTLTTQNDSTALLTETPSAPPKPANQVYIGNLPDSTTLQSLRDAFSSISPIVSIELRMPYAMIEFEKDGAAAEAVERFNEGTFGGSEIVVERAVVAEEEPEAETEAVPTVDEVVVAEMITVPTIEAVEIPASVKAAGALEEIAVQLLEAVDVPTSGPEEVPEVVVPIAPIAPISDANAKQEPAELIVDEGSGEEVIPGAVGLGKRIHTDEDEVEDVAEGSATKRAKED